MLHNTPDFRHRAHLAELMDEPCSREELRACLRDIARTNRWTMAYRPLIDWLSNIIPAMPPIAGPIRILDVGCGYGDTLRRIEQWAGTRAVKVELTGLDLNPDATAIAFEASSPTSSIQWKSGDVFSYAAQRPPHLVISSNFTHHLADDNIIRYLRWMEDHAETGWFINDLSRAAVPYYFFRGFSKLARLHPFVQHDGPASIARSFVPDDWRRMCLAAGIEMHDVEIQPYRPARLCVARRKRR